MERQGPKRALAKEAVTDKVELIAHAQEEELKLLSFEAGMRVAGVRAANKQTSFVGCGSQEASSRHATSSP